MDDQKNHLERQYESKTILSPQTAAYRLPSEAYPALAPFHPAVSYPEYKWGVLGPSNLVYAGVRELFHLLGLDESRYDTSGWNPLGCLIQPGDKVVIKPNLLRQSHKYLPNEWEQVVTHGSVVRAVVDFVLIALKGHGEVWIVDGPTLDANWREILSRTGLRSVCEFYTSVSSVPVRTLDLRDTWIDVRDDVVYERVPLSGDPAGSTVIDLGQRSQFVGHQGANRYYGADYDQDETNGHHTQGRHEYRISRTVASADVFINLPKMKTHSMVGVTLCLKNLVGINTGINWLPHYTQGDPSNGGDQFPIASLKSKSERFGLRLFRHLALRNPMVFAPMFRTAVAIATPILGHTREVPRNGHWYGNDTAWRMAVDINRCLLYSDGEKFPSSSPKRYFAIVDGVIAGDGDGPVAPDRYEAGVLIAGFNPVAVDCVTTRLMGLDPMKLPMLCQAFQPSELALAQFAYSDITVQSNRVEWQGWITSLSHEDCYRFRPHFGWKGRIEWNSSAEFRDPGHIVER